VRQDLAVLAGAVAVLILAALLEPHPDVVRLFGHDVPPLCVFSVATGLSCPGCGLTRSFAFLEHGDLRAAFALHPLGPVLWLAVAAQLPYRLLRLWRGYDGPIGVAS
jgi:hypothetical protein